MHAKRRLIATVTVLGLGGASLAQTPPSPPLPSLQEEAELGIAWGVMTRLAGLGVFDHFAAWANKKIAARQERNAGESLAANAALATVVNLTAYLPGKGGVAAGAEPNVRPGTPQLPLRVDENGENYQGVNVAVASMDDDGKPREFRPLGGGFATDERFKLRLLSTFDAVVVLGSVNPAGVSRQIYPAKAGYAVAIPAGKAVLLPLGPKEYLKFPANMGQERLTFTVRDPRSLDPGHTGTGQVFRRDEAFGSSFVQPVTPDRFPVIAESITLERRTGNAP
jgi:hypothetical protein